MAQPFVMCVQSDGEEQNDRLEGETQLRTWGLDGPGGLLCHARSGFDMVASLWPSCDTARAYSSLNTYLL